MSIRSRNPFIMRASEKIETDASFLRLYNPTILDCLIEKNDKDKLWNNVVFIHSSPGAGKSSLLRVFEPSPLKILSNNKKDFKELHTRLSKLGVVGTDSIELLGVILTCTRNYEILDDLGLSVGKSKLLFFTLLNSRVMLALLKAITQLHQVSLEQITFSYDNYDNYFRGISTPCSGKELYDWASNIEKGIYKIIDSFLPENENIENHEELFAFLLKPDNFLVNNKPVSSKILFMLDDTHKLSTEQRTNLKKYVIEKRGRFNIWIGERLEALEPKENLGSYVERDYEIIDIEKFWNDKPKRLEDVLYSIADKRAGLSSEGISSFKDNITNDIYHDQFDSKLKEIIDSTFTNILAITSHAKSKYDIWIKYLNNFDSSNLYHKAIVLLAGEIIIRRSLRKDQLSLLELGIPEKDLIEKLNVEAIREAARLFLTEKEKKLPYYYDTNTLARLASNNIEQFLAFASELFEEMIANKVLGKLVTLTADSQDKVIRRVALKKWSELRRLVPHSNEVFNFLRALGGFFYKQTYQPNAPYAPGVNGFAIKDKVLLTLIDEGNWQDDPIYQPLVNVISTCIAYNLLEIKRVSQGEKGQQWDVYYLNRWLCVQFNLPLSYGGWRHISTNDLLKWTKA